MPDANDWMAAIDAEIDNIQRLNVFKEVPHPNGKNIRGVLTHRAQGAISSMRVHSGIVLTILELIFTSQ